MLNHVVLIGRLCKDPELRYTAAGKAVASFRLAVDRPGPDNEADFFDIVTWERLAENVANNLKKGRLVAVEGRIQVRSYETSEGQRRERTEVVAREVRFLDRAREEGENA